MTSGVVFSCFIYLLTFVLSCIFIANGEKAKKNRKIIVAFGLLLPCLLAGLRARTVGTDVRVYVIPMYEAAMEASGIRDFYTSLIPYGYSFRSIYEYEYGFTFVLFLVTKLTKKLQAVLFVIQALTVFPLYSGLKAFKKHDEDFSTWIGMMAYYLFFYNTSLNVMRQWIAIAVLVFATKYLFSNQHKKYYIAVLVASLFHTSALLGVFVGLIYYYLYNRKKSRWSVNLNGKTIRNRSVRTFLAIFAVALALLSIAAWKPILEMFGFGRYGTYIGDGLIFSANQIILRMPLFVVYLFRKRRLRHNSYYALFIVLFFIDVALSQLVYSSTYAYRIAMYFSGYNVFLYPITFCEKNKRAGVLMLGAFLLVYWMYMVVYTGSDTMPYHFYFQ